MLNKELDSLLNQTEIDELNIHTEVLKQPVFFLKWAIRAARCERKVKKIQLQTKVIAAEEMKRIRQEHFKQTGKELPMTASLDKTDLPLSEKYKAQLELQSDMEEELDILIAAKEAAKQRKDMITNYCLLIRDEIKSDILIKRKSE